MPDTLIALETATDLCGVALARGGRIVAELALRRPRAHAENLVPMIEDALRYAGVEARELDAVAVSRGPGSYTGLRIGASTAKGLAAAVGARLVAVPSLEAVAASAAGQANPGDVLCAAFDARRDELYAAAFRVRDDGGLEPLGETVALAADELAGWLDLPEGYRLWLVGEGAPKAAEALARHGRPATALDPALYGPSASWIARMAQARLARGEVEDVAAFEPHYLKEFVAKKPKGTVFERLTF